MTIELRMKPNDPVMSWDEFRASRPPFSIAIDGYVGAGPCFDTTGPWLNLNHHEGVERLATRATCEQALVYVRQELFKRFTRNNEPTAIVWANDCDQDVCLAWFVFKYHYLAQSTMNLMLNRLVGIEGLLDTTAGAYPFPADLPAFREIAWVFEPYTHFRVSGGIDRRNENEFVDVATNVEQRILAHIAGRGGAIALDLRYDTLRRGTGWVMVSEVGANARTGMFADGVRAYVSVRDRGQGRWSYTVGRMSQFVPFDIPRIFSELTRAELARGGHPFGCGNTIGGSDRALGSVQNPDEVFAIVEQAATAKTT